MGQAKLKAVKKIELLRLDLGAGSNPREGFHGVDIRKLPEVGTVFDLRKTPWPWANESVDEAVSSHFIEHLDGDERILFFNELYRVMKFDAKAQIICPNWSHERAYGDPTHKWPPMSSFMALYLNKAWREGTKEKDFKDANARHVPYSCDFDFVAGVGFDPWLAVRNDEFKQFAAARYVNSHADLYLNLTKTKR